MLRVEIQKNLFSPTGNFSLEVSFELPKHQFLSLYGRSGSGKTTTLRIIAGLETPDKGVVSLDGEVWFDSSKNINLPPQKRSIGMFFQSYALFPNMTVMENILYSKKKRSMDFINKVVETMEIAPLLERKIATLSGGQKQRVALARAIVSEPELLLLDEPLSAIDMSVRLKLQTELREIHDKFGLTTIIVSHDMQEVLKLSDKTMVIENGKITKVGSPKEIFFGNRLSSKFAFQGYVVDIIKSDILYLLFIDINGNIVEVSVSERDISDLKVGDKVIVATKAYNPIIKKYRGEV